MSWLLPSGCVCADFSLTADFLHTAMYFQQEFPTATMKHLLGKNGTRKTPEAEGDLQCEKLLNNLAVQQKRQQFAIENSSPPSKRQRLLGANENNLVVLADTLSGPSDSSPNEPLASVQNRRVLAFFSVPTKASCSDATDVPFKSTTVQQQQPSNNQPDAAHDIVCIDDDDDDDDDDSVVVLTDSPKKANGCAVVPLVSVKNAEPLCQKVPSNPVSSRSSSAVNAAVDDDDSVVVLTDSPKAKGCAVVPLVSVKNAELPFQKTTSSTVSSSSSSAVSATSSSAVMYSVANSENNCAAASVSRDDTADSENISSLSGVDGQHQASATASRHHSPSSRKIDRLEKSLEVGVFALGFLSYRARKRTLKWKFNYIIKSDLIKSVFNAQRTRAGSARQYNVT